MFKFCVENPVIWLYWMCLFILSIIGSNTKKKSLKKFIDQAYLWLVIEPC